MMMIDYREMAESNTILRCQVGSGMHGTGLEGHEDRDEMGLCIEPPEYVIGLSRFEQYIYRTQPEGVRSGFGDLDLTIYSLRKWMRLALQGNPSILLPLFVPDNELMVCTAKAHALRIQYDAIISKQAGYRFLGYMRAQRGKMVDGKNGHTNRPELVEQYGYDTKFAMHMLRLGYQGIELMRTGRITLPVPEHERVLLIDVRKGIWSKQAVLNLANDLEAKLSIHIVMSSLPEKPDYGWANEWLLRAYTEHWHYGKYIELS